MKEIVFFDLDGTLIDSSRGIYMSINYALEKMDWPTLTEEQLRTFIGPPLLDSFKKIGMTDETAELGVKYYRELYAQKGMYEVHVYDGISDTLAALHQTKALYLATSKPEKFAKEIIENLGFSNYFSGIYGADLEGKRSAKSDVLAYALSETNAVKEEAVMIGDRQHDVLGAKNNGLASIGVLYGFGDREELKIAGADAIIQHPQELLSLLDKEF